MKVIDSCSVHAPHSAQLVFSRWADPAGWPTWDPEVREVRFAGPARLGAQGRIHPTSGPAATFTITAFEHDRVFTDTSSLPGAKLIFEHRVTPTPEGAAVDVTVSVDGFLGPLWHRVLGKSLRNAAQSSVAGLLDYLDEA